MRGCPITLGDNDYGTSSSSGHVQVLDHYAKQQPHVCRSITAVELHAVLDWINQGTVITCVLAEMK
eukprot:4497024-Heterocapsa_arctica.AAC.1